VRQIKLFVRPASGGEDFARLGSGPIKDVPELLAREAILEIVAPLIVDVLRTEELLSLFAGRSRWVDVDFHHSRLLHQCADIQN